MGLVFYSLKNNIKRTLHWQKDGRWLIENKNIKQSALLQAGSVVTPFFAALKFKLENKKTLNIILFSDSLDAEKFRQLRLRLKVQGIKVIADILKEKDNANAR